MLVTVGGRGMALPAVFFAICLSVLSLNALAEVPTANGLFAENYTAAWPVGQDQAQVIYYRIAGDRGKGVANVYLDQELVSALLPGGYVSFCLRPGGHILGAYLNDAPLYSGKSKELYGATFQGA